MITLTVFTPTYNRERTLHRVYQSLIMQTCKDFKWLIIDDGSQDDTEKIVNKWLLEGIIDIEYVKQSNKGKAKTINRSLELTSTELWICLDSDDYFLNNAIELILENYRKIRDDDSICGMISLRCDEYGNPMQNKSIPENLQVLKQGHLRYNLNIPPEYAQVYKVDILKNYKYPEIDNENYFPLSYVADQLDQNYSLLVIHDCYMVIEYQKDGITNNNSRHIVKNPIGYTLFRAQQIRLAPNFNLKFKAAVAYNAASFISKIRVDFVSSLDRILVRGTYLIGFIYYWVKLKKHLL